METTILTPMVSNQGIYQITSQITGKIYIGKSVELKKRYGKHLILLRKNKHYNEYMQRHYNKYGEADFIYSVLEFTFGLDRKYLSEREIYWIELNGAYKNGNFNLTRGGESGAGLSQSTPIQLKNIHSGEIKDFQSLSDAGRQLGISPSDITRLLKKKRVNRLKDWTRVDHDYSQVRKNQKEFTLYHEEYGKVTENSKADFARKIGVHQTTIHYLIIGKTKNCKGWRLTPFE